MNMKMQEYDELKKEAELLLKKKIKKKLKKNKKK